MFQLFGFGLLLLVLSITSSLAKVVPLIQPGFFFDYYDPAQHPPIPLTRQCERIHITWNRSLARGQNPTAPFTLQVFTDRHITPFVIPFGSGSTFDWDVPFAPGTQYQICMFDANGVPGGCQFMYTVVENTTVANPTCQNVTAPPQLEVEGKVAGQPMSQFGVVDQCTDISITPKAGKPPFTLTVSPALHPPYNITSQNMDPIVWTVSLSWSYPFFMSLVSSDGLMWANGPMHSGGFGPDDCLAPGSIPRKKAAGIAAGASFATLFGSLLLGYAGRVLFKNSQAKRLSHPERGPFKELKDTDLHYNTWSGERPDLPERFTSLRDENEWDPNARPEHYRTSDSAEQIGPNVPPPVRTRTVILHYDGGRVRTGRREAEDVIELPPEYQRPSSYGDTSISSESESTAPTRRPHFLPDRKRLRSTNQ